MKNHLLVFAITSLTLASPLFAQRYSQGDLPLAAPGLRVPGGPLPYALDHFQGLPQLVPVHHTSVELNNHKAANVTGSLAGSFFYKPKMSVEAAGAHARTILHDARPVFFIHILEDPDGAGDTASRETPSFAIVHATVDKDRRIFAQIRFTQLTGEAKRKEGIVDVETERLVHGWLKITPREDLAPCEYAFTPLAKAQNAFSTVVFDFAIDPAAFNLKDAIKPIPAEDREP